MESPDNPSSTALSQLLWAGDPLTQNAILIVLAVAALAVILVYAPLVIRLVRVALLVREVRDACSLDDRSGEEHRREITRAFSGSPLSWHWEEFMHRWQASQTGGPRESAPIRLMDVFGQSPLLETGVRRTLLPSLPGLFLAIGVLGTFVGLMGAVDGAAIGLTDPAERAAWSGMLTAQIGLALRTSLWGLLLSIAAALGSRLLEGGFEHYEESLDHWVERAFGSVSVGELANMSSRAQRDAFEGLGGELRRFSTDLGDRIDSGLSRIEHSTVSAAQLVSDEQRTLLQSVVRELSLQVQRGVEEHLSELHRMLERAVDHQGAVTGGLAEAFEQMTANSEAHTRITQVLGEAAIAVNEAAGTLSGTAVEMSPVLEHLREAGGALQETSATLQATQEVALRTAEGIRSSLDHASTAMSEQREFIEGSLSDVRTTLALMNTGLGENLEDALRGFDEPLTQAVDRLRDTVSESNGSKSNGSESNDSESNDSESNDTLARASLPTPAADTLDTVERSPVEEPSAPLAGPTASPSPVTPVAVAPAPVPIPAGETEGTSANDDGRTAIAPEPRAARTVAKNSRKKKRSSTKMIAAAAAAATNGGSASPGVSDPPEADESLEPDLYQRLDDSGEGAFDRQRRLLQSGRSMHSLEVDPAPAPPPVEPGDPALAELGASPTRVSEDESMPDSNDSTSGLSAMDESTEKNAEPGGKRRLRGWRLMGKK